MTPYDEFTDHGVRWAVLPEARSLVIGPDGFRLQEWLDAGITEIVKTGPARTVYRVALPQRTLYVKVYRVPSAGEFVRHLVRPSKGRREWDQARAVADRNVPTVKPLALGERYRLGAMRENYLVVEGIDDVEPLDQFLLEVVPRLPARTSARVRRRVAEALGDLVATAHLAGVHHTDLHAGNILVRSDDDQVRLFLIDLHRVRVGRPLGRLRAPRNLAQLNMFFSQVASRADRFRFFARYAERTGMADRGRLAAQARQIERATERRCRRQWTSRDERAIGNNKYFYHLEVAGARGYAVRDLDLDRFAALMADPDASFDDPDVVTIKAGDNSSIVRRVLPLQGGDLPVLYIRHNPKPVRTALSTMWRGSRAWRAWRAGNALLVRGLPTPRPIAAFEVLRAGRVRHSYQVVEEIVQAKNLRDFVTEDLAPLPPADQRPLQRQLADELARLIGRLHRCDISQRDLKAPNVLVERVAESGIRLYLVDLEGMRICRRLRWARRVQNLARLHVSFHDNPLVTLSDKRRFLRLYMSVAGLPARRWRKLWRAIAAATQRKVALNRRRSRPIT